jgi:plasminogen activator
MVSKNLKRSCVYLSALFVSASFPLTSFAATGKTSSTEPVTTSSIVRQPDGYISDTKPTDPVLVASATPESYHATEPVTVNSTSRTGVSTPTNIVEKQASININDSVIMVSGQLSMGFMNGTAHERVYDPTNDHKNSELIWSLDQVFMLGAGVSVKPLSWLRFNGNIWFNAGDGGGTMDDYDWRVYEWTEWTDWSHHDDVTVTKAILFDLNMELTFLRYNEAAVFALLGYKHDNWKWEGSGGTYIYSSTYLRDTRGTFPNEKVITYEQTYDVPYLGIGFRANLDPVTVSGRLIGSTLAKASDEDHHLLRDLEISSDNNSGNMIAFDISCIYNFTPHLAAIGAFQYQKYEELKGDHNWNFFKTGEKFTYDGSMDNEISLISLSFLYTL